MRNLLVAAAAMTTLLFAVPSGSAQAAPIVGASPLANHAPANVENVTFFRCGFFGNRCRGDFRRDNRRGFRDRRFSRR